MSYGPIGLSGFAQFKQNLINSISDFQHGLGNSLGRLQDKLSQSTENLKLWLQYSPSLVNLRDRINTILK